MVHYARNYYGVKFSAKSRDRLDTEMKFIRYGSHNRSNSVATWFCGQEYRSRLEARWAVFFKELGVVARYEHDTFRRYVPDFKLSRVACRHAGGSVYIEIKPTVEERQRGIEKFKACARTLHTFVGDPPGAASFVENDWSRVKAVPVFSACSLCGTVDLGLGDLATCSRCDSDLVLDRVTAAARVANDWLFDNPADDFKELDT